MKKNRDTTHFGIDLFDDIDQSAKTNNYFFPVLKEISEKVNFEQKSLLDLGCGSGVFVAPFTNLFKEVIGVDGEASVFKRAKANGYKNVVKIEDLSKDYLPFKNNSFDFVLCKDVFEHLINPLHLLKEIQRVLKTNGYFIFHVPNHFPLFKRLFFIYYNSIDTYNFFPNYDSWTNPHIRFYNTKDIKKRMIENSFNLDLDLSHHFPAFPLSPKLRFGGSLISKLQNKFPDQFNAGYTYLFRKD